MRQQQNKVQCLDEELVSVMGKADPLRGRTPSEIDRWCEHRNISHYALDFNHKVFLKEVRGHKHKALIYYCVNGHIE